MSMHRDPRHPPAASDPSQPRGLGHPSRTRRGRAVGLLGALGVLLGAAALPRDTLWRVEQTCLLDYRATGASFPCLDVDPSRGVAVLRAPFRQTHIVTMPIMRVSGVEAPELAAEGALNYFQAAWDKRHFVQADSPRPLGWTDFGLAANSRETRSQDQLHIHVDCVRRSVKRILGERLVEFPADRWLPAGFVFQRQSYWVRRVDKATLEGVNLFALAHEIPELRDHPALAVLAVIGVAGPPSGNGFLLLAGQSDPSHGAAQSTSEDLLDHACNRPA